MEQDRIRPVEMDGSGRGGVEPASFLSQHRAVPGPRPRRPNNWDNSGTRPEAGEIALPGMLEPALPAPSAFQRLPKLAAIPFTPARTSAASVSKLAVYASRRLRITTSTGGRTGSMAHRASSRSRRFNRLRSTLVCPCFGTISPTRGCGRGEATARNSRCSVRMRFPSRAMTRMSASRVSLRLRGNRKASGAGVLARQLNREPLTPFLPAPAQNFSPPTCRHPRAKAMRLDTALVTGTVRGLTHAVLQNGAEIGGGQNGKGSRNHEIGQWNEDHCAMLTLTFPHGISTFAPPPTFPHLA